MKTKKPPTAIRSKATKPAALPDWVTFEPEPFEFHLEVCDFNDKNQMTKERIEMTQDEYMALKAHLAKLRGFEVPAEQAADAA